jgi:hypothetical protein
MADAYKKNSITLLGAIAMGTGVMIGAGIFALTGQIAELAGPLFPLSFVVGAIVTAFSAYITLGEVFDVSCSGCAADVAARLTRLAATPQYTPRWCQTNANWSLCALPVPSSGSKKTAPLGQSSGAAQLEILSAVEGAFPIEMVVGRGVNGGEFLQRSHSSEPQHGALAPSKWLMGVLGAIVQPTAGFLALGVADNLHRHTVRSKLVRDQNLGRSVAAH